MHHRASPLAPRRPPDPLKAIGAADNKLLSAHVKADCHYPSNLGTA
jgi:hypothetical protein